MSLYAKSRKFISTTKGGIIMFKTNMTFFTAEEISETLKLMTENERKWNESLETRMKSEQEERKQSNSTPRLGWSRMPFGD